MLVKRETKEEAQRIATIADVDKRIAAVLAVIQERDREKAKAEELQRISSGDRKTGAASSDSSKKDEKIKDLEEQLTLALKELDKKDEKIEALEAALEKTTDGVALLKNIEYGYVFTQSSK